MCVCIHLCVCVGGGGGGGGGGEMGGERLASRHQKVLKQCSPSHLKASQSDHITPVTRTLHRLPSKHSPLHKSRPCCAEIVLKQCEAQSVCRINKQGS